MVLSLLLCGLLNRASAQQHLVSSSLTEGLPDAPASRIPIETSQGTVNGTVTDQDGAIIPGARLTLAPQGYAHSGEQVTVSDSAGRFSFTNVAPGPFQLTVTAIGFASRHTFGDLNAGQSYEVPDLCLSVATSIDVDAVSQYELAEEQIRDEEKQRVLGFIPNFYVSYEADPQALATRQKFELSWKTSFDMTNFVLIGLAAGLQQSENTYEGYGQGSQGYAKRYGAAYATFFTGNVLGNAIFPAIFKQDPRYIYKGTGTKRSRILYAMANAVICRGDNGRWQPNYSSVLGSMASGALSNLYYPAADRDGAGLTFENAGIGIASSAAANLFQEFVVRKFTPHARVSEVAAR